MQADRCRVGASTGERDRMCIASQLRGKSCLLNEYVGQLRTTETDATMTPNYIQDALTQITTK